MRKIFFTICTLMLLVCSCDLNLTPTSSISTADALSSMDDAQKLRRDLYITIRSSIASGAPVYIQELMTDSFHGSITYGNSNGEYYKWEMRSTFGNIESLWSNCYYLVMLANFLEDGIPELAKNATNAEKEQYNVILGECAFSKAFAMFKLTQLYCGNYDASTASTAMGVMLSDSPFTTPSVQSSYPGRSSMADTYAYIESNLSKAESLLAGVKGSEGAIYFTADAVKALKARIALTKGDYGTAAQCAEAIISSGTYPLIDNEDDFVQMWRRDSGKECIVQMWADVQSTPSSNDWGYIKYTGGIYAPNYIPEKWITEAYAKGDYRFSTWFKYVKASLGNYSGDIYICYKFPGNPDIMKSATATDCLHKVKLFRTAEQYLIAAEANARLNNGTKANDYLNALRKSRIPGYVNHAYSGDELMAEIKAERAKEFYGEGFRYTDLKRWNEGFARSEAQNKELVVSAGSTNTELLSRTASDPFWLWPIPQAEIDSNPQIRTQQNPGY